MKFNSDKFSFDNTHCSMKNVSLLWGNDMFIQYGLNYKSSLSYDKLNWKSEVDTPDTFTLQVVYEKNNIPLAWTPSKIRDIESWLITDYFAPFISDDNKDVTYYLKVVNITRNFDAVMRGWLEVEFQPMSHYGYITQNITLKNAARFKDMKSPPAMTIVNQSDLNRPYYPVVKIRNLNGEVSISNITTNKTLVVNGQGDITIDNAMKTVIDSEGNNLIGDCNRQWIHFNQGSNKIQVIGDCDITFISKYEVRA
ncbi:MAG: hypothetical protein ACRC18_06295 [Cetobacterium sp.]